MESAYFSQMETYNKENIAIFIFSLHAYALPGFNKIGDEVSWDSLPEKPDDTDLISKKYFRDICDYLIEIYLQNLDKRLLDEVVESLAIFFSKVHAKTLPIFNLDAAIIQEEYSYSLTEKEWDGHNWEYLKEVSDEDNTVDKKYFRRIAKHFMKSCLNINILPDKRPGSD
jgi:hypothetical protein